MSRHDRPADLPDRLVAHGFEPDPVETVMIGRAELLDQPVGLPDGIAVRRAGDGRDLLDDVARASRMQADVFGRSAGPDAAELADKLAQWDGRRDDHDARQLDARLRTGVCHVTSDSETRWRRRA